MEELCVGVNFTKQASFLVFNSADYPIISFPFRAGLGCNEMYILYKLRGRNDGELEHGRGKRVE